MKNTKNNVISKILLLIIYIIIFPIAVLIGFLESIIKHSG